MMSRPGESIAGTDAGMAAIGAKFGAGFAVGAGLGQGAAAAAAEAAGGVPVRRRCPVFPFMLPNGLLTATAVGSVLDIPQNFGPRDGFAWDVTLLNLSGFTAGAVTVSKNGFDVIYTFTAAGSQHFPQKAEPLLTDTERLVFTVTSAITGNVQVGGSVIMVPIGRLDDYLS